MKLPPGKFSSKVLTPFQINLIVTIVVGIVTKSPLSENPWLGWLTDAAVVGALITFLGAIVGYQTEETSFDNSES